MKISKLITLGLAIVSLCSCGGSGVASSSSSTSSTGTNKFMDVKYGPDEKYNLVDIYLPKKDNVPGSYPLVIFSHGGGWSSNDRKLNYLSNLYSGLLRAGFAVARIEYHLCQNHNVETYEGVVPEGDSVSVCDESAFPQMLYDVKAATRFLRANAEKYHFDTNNFFYMGESAGAHLSMLAAATEGKDGFEDKSMGYENVSTKVNAVVSLFGPTLYSLEENMTKLSMLAIFGPNYTEDDWKTSSPYYQVDNTMCPLFLAHGEKDTTVPISHSKEMETKVKSLIGEDKVETYYFESGTHADSIHFASQEAISNYVSFLNKYTVK